MFQQRKYVFSTFIGWLTYIYNSINVAKFNGCISGLPGWMTWVIRVTILGYNIKGLLKMFWYTMIAKIVKNWVTSSHQPTAGMHVSGSCKWVSAWVIYKDQYLWHSINPAVVLVTVFSIIEILWCLIYKCKF